MVIRSSLDCHQAVPAQSDETDDAIAVGARDRRLSHHHRRSAIVLEAEEEDDRYVGEQRHVGANERGDAEDPD